MKNHLDDFLRFLVCMLLLTSMPAGLLLAVDDGSVPKNPQENRYGLYPADHEFGGYLKLRGQTAWPDEDSILTSSGDGTLLDGSVEGRLKGALFLNDSVAVEAHYEAVGIRGDSQETGRDPERRFSGFNSRNVSGTRIPEDNRRLFDMTAVISDGPNHILYHRIDRLFATLTPHWGTVRIGRQAVTWGNGLLFNPMDLFNPFAPADIEREYKIGDDMVSIQRPFPDTADLHVLVVPRRDPDSSGFSSDHSSFAAKIHFSRGMGEYDLMTARHYDDWILGIGVTGHLEEAIWRMDAVWTELDAENRSAGFLSLLINIDYSWVWQDRNYYGFMEFYYNGAGENDYEKAFSSPDLMERIDRGELYVLGKTYVGGSIRVELHPLVNANMTVITGLKTPSAVLQPNIACDVSEDMRFLIGASIPRGPKGSEFGGIEIPGTGFTTRSADTVFAWLSYYF